MNVVGIFFLCIPRNLLYKKKSKAENGTQHKLKEGYMRKALVLISLDGCRKGYTVHDSPIVKWRIVWSYTKYDEQIGSTIVEATHHERSIFVDLDVPVIL